MAPLRDKIVELLMTVEGETLHALPPAYSHGDRVDLALSGVVVQTFGPLTAPSEDRGDGSVSEILTGVPGPDCFRFS